MRFCKLLLPLLVSSLAFAAQPDRILSPIDSSRSVVLAGHVAPQAQPQYDRGPVDASYPLTVTMLLMPTAGQDLALRELLAEQQESASPNFHKWLTPEQFADRFSLSPNDIGRITSWLTAQGFKVTYVARGRDSVTFQGDAAQVQSAFKTAIHIYDVNGEKHFGNSTPPVIPAALSGIVGGFRGLHNFVPRPLLRQHPDYTITSIPETHFLAPGDIAAIYDINPLYQGTTVIDGTGQKMVIVGQTDIYLADINDFRSGFGLSTIPTSGANSCSTDSSGVVISPCDTTNFQFVLSGTGSDPGVSAGDLGESDLDIEWSGAVARNAQIIFVTSSDVGDSASWAIDNNLAPVMSMSYGLCEALNTAPGVASQEVVFKKAYSMGIGFFASSGDTGAATCDGSTGNASATLGLSVNYPSSSAYVTGVGGTEFNEGVGDYWNATNSTNGFSAKGYIPELAWNDSNLPQVDAPDAGGGGPSNCVNGSGTTGTVIQGQTYPIEVCDAPSAGGFPKPTWQVGLTPNDSVRDVPDISFSASNVNDPYIVCTAQSETTGSSSTSTCVNGITTAVTTWNSAFGGTSVSSPVMAGIAVLLNQYLGAPVGNVNTQLYKLFVSNPSTFHDIIAGFNSQTENDSNNVVSCVVGDPSFEPSALRCPAGGTFGYSAGPGYDLATGLGSFDVNALFLVWAASLSPDFQLTAGNLTPNPVSAGQSATATLTIAPVTGSTPTVVNFSASSCTGLPAGASCSFNPASVTFDGITNAATTLTISTTANMALPSGAQTITITPTNSSNTSTTVSLTVTATTESFTITPGVTTLSLAPGATTGNTVNLTVTDPGNTGFIVNNGGTLSTAVPVTYSCSMTGFPSEAGCVFSPSATTSSTALTVSITSTAPTAQLRPPLGRGNSIFYAMLLPGLFGIVFAAGSGKRGARLLSLIVVLGFSTLWLGACGGSSSSTSMKNPGTAAGNYTVTVNATTGGANPITASTSFMLTVQ